MPAQLQSTQLSTTVWHLEQSHGALGYLARMNALAKSPSQQVSSGARPGAGPRTQRAFIHAVVNLAVKPWQVTKWDDKVLGNGLGSV